MKLKDVLEKTSGFFRDKGFPSARLDAELLLADALKVDRIRLYLDFDRPLAEAEVERCREVVRRRTQGEPVAYILGKKGFFGLSFDVSPAVLIPRPETEHLVEEALGWAKNSAKESLNVVDLGCGSGCIGISVLKNCPSARLLALDVSEEAVKLSEINAQKNDVSDRARFFCADANSNEIGEILKRAGVDQIDLLLANPPYIDPNDQRTEENVKRYEPSAALFAGEQGLADLKSWTQKWAPFMAENSLCVMEMGNTQGADMKEFFQQSGFFKEVSIGKDLAGHDRLIKGARHG